MSKIENRFKNAVTMEYLMAHVKKAGSNRMASLILKIDSGKGLA